jgi:hypothetical protein
MVIQTNLANFFSQEDYNCFIQEKSRAITPIFYEILDSETQDFRGCMIGSYHALNLWGGMEFDMTPSIRKCFDYSKKVFMEIDFWTIYGNLYSEEKIKERLTEVYEETRGMDFKFTLDAKKENKEIHALEREEERSEPKLSAPSREYPQCLSSPKWPQLILEGAAEEIHDKYRSCYPEQYPFFVKRNQNMSERIDAALKKDKDPSFIAVGAAHLEGEEGICKLLVNRGWSVRRVY